MMRSHTPRRWRAALACVLTAAMLTACGSGDSDGDGRTAGIEGTGIVSGFGSVYIDGIEFETDDATILFVGEQVAESMLSVGDRVTVTGTLDEDGRAHAQRIVYQRTLDGPIDTIETDGERGRLIALGQTVYFDADTAFVGVAADDLAEGDLIAVSGFTGTQNDVYAQSVRRNDDGFAPNVSILEIEGRIDAVNDTRLNIGEQIVDFSNAQVRPDRAALTTGRRIEAFGTRDAASDEPFIATRIDVLELNRAPEGRRMLVEARIRDYDGPSDFVAGNWRIDASDAERVDDGATPLGPGVEVSVRGVFESDRVRATTLRVEPASDTTFEASIEAVDTQAQTITLFGRTISLPDDTRYSDSRDTGSRTLRIDTLSPNDPVRVRAYLDADTAVARSLERLETFDPNESAIAGRVTEIEPNETLVVAGVTARTDTNTTYYDADDNMIDADTFFERATPGTRVRLSGPKNAEQISSVQVARLQQDGTD